MSLPSTAECSYLKREKSKLYDVFKKLPTSYQLNKEYLMDCSPAYKMMQPPVRLNSKCLCPKTYHRSTVIKRVLIQKPSREVIFTERRSVSGGSEKTVDDPVKATVDA
ncbi:Hypothetical predicted protein [Podarcis lilfordi]|uniref:Uncharacterized protein n=1 Tax=Podarcis lilfordi TaxID=74358 RepID=A0AA35KXY5_9SAUR|nr:Hypothetical predicted protein [Podarcis lilfordi]